MEFDIDAGQAGLDSGGLPLDEGVEDGLSLGMFELEKAGCGMLGDEIEDLQNSDSHLFLGQFWELVFELAKGLGIGLGLGVKLVVSIFACAILPNPIGEGLETMSVWGVVVSFVGDANQRGAAPSAKVVVPEVLERGLLVDQSFVGNCWNPNIGHEVRVVVLVKGLKRPWSIGDDGQVGDWSGFGCFGFIGCVQPWAWVDHVILAVGGLEAPPAKDVGVGLASV